MRLVFNVGHNDSDYTVTPVNKPNCQYYVRWRCMLQRCYSAQFQEEFPSYKGLSVYKPWHSFLNFRSWMETQNWQERVLNYNLINPDSKNYNPDSSVFITRSLTGLLSTARKETDFLPVGVTTNKRNPHYEANCRYGGRRFYLGAFKTIKEADRAHRTFKYSVLMYLCELETDKKIKRGIFLAAKRVGNYERLGYKTLQRI